MTTTYVPGYLTEIEIGADDLTVIGQVVSYSDDAAAVPKPVFGQQSRNTVRGQKVYTIEVSGHLAAEFTGILFGLNTQPGAIPWQIQIGLAAAPTDGGLLTGDAVITNLTMDADAEGNWAWSMSLEGDGPADHTPPA